MAKKSSKQSKQLALAGAVAPSTNFTYDTQRLIERPADYRQIFKRCRVVAQESSFLTVYLPLKLSFYHAGFAIGLGPASQGADDQLSKWTDAPFEFNAEYTNPATQEVLKIETNMTVGEAINRFMLDIWKEYLLLDYAIPLWDDSGRAPVVAPPEKCRYIDNLGLQVLFYQHGLSSLDILLLDPAQQDRYRQYSEIMINPQFGEHFKVLKRAQDGTAFTSYPSLYSIMRTLAEVDYKEQGFHAQAFNMRGAPRQHKLGHNYTQGPAAGKPTYFWNAKRDKSVLAMFKNRVGPHDVTTNFDHEILFPWPDVKVFDEIAWKGTNLRLRNWGGPIAQMLLSDKVSEGGLSFLRTQVNADRREVSDFVLPIIKTAFKAPANLDIRLNWSDLPFIDPQHASDIIKFGVQQGFCSVATARQIIGLNNERENALKLIEAADKDATAHFTPAWDMAHGIAPQQGQTVADLKATPGAGTPPGEPGRTQGS